MVDGEALARNDSPPATGQPYEPGLRVAEWLFSRDLSDDHAALAAGLGLCVFLVGIKAYLLTWYRLGGIQPVPAGSRLFTSLLFGYDAFTAALFAGSCFCFLLVSRLLKFPAPLRIGFIAGAYAGAVGISVISTRLQQLYGQPLTLAMLNWFRDLGALRDSLTGSIDISLMAILTLGLLSLPIAYAAGRPLLARLRLRRWSLWAFALGLPLAAAIASGLAFRGVEMSLGLKQDSVLIFVRWNWTEPSKADFRRELEQARAAGELSGTLDPDLRSIVYPGQRDSGAFARANLPAGANLLLIILESTPADALDSATTPNLLALASRATVLGHHYSTAPVTFDAQYAILFSQLSRHTAFDYRSLYQGPPRDVSLLDVARAAGMRTAVFLSSYSDVFDERWLYEGKTEVFSGAENTLAGLQPGWSWGAPEEKTVDELLVWLRKNQNQRFFAIYNLVNPHHPYTSPDQTFPGRGKDIAYRNALHYADGAVGRLLTGLDSLDLTSKTIVVAVADHGEEIGRGHGYAFHFEEVHVPSMVAIPGNPPARVDTMTSHLDLAPTLATMLGLRPDPEWLGRDLTATSVERRLSFFASVFGERTAVIDGVSAIVLDHDRGDEKLLILTDKVLPGSSETALEPTLLAELRQAAAVYDRRIRLRHFQRALLIPHSGALSH